MTQLEKGKIKNINSNLNEENKFGAFHSIVAQTPLSITTHQDQSQFILEKSIVVLMLRNDTAKELRELCGLKVLNPISSIVELHSL